MNSGMNRDTRRAVCFATTHELTIFHNLGAGQGKQQARLGSSQVQKSKALKLDTVLGLSAHECNMHV